MGRKIEFACGKADEAHPQAKLFLGFLPLIAQYAVTCISAQIMVNLMRGAFFTYFCKIFIISKKFPSRG